MCYSEPHNVIESIARQDADVITIETSLCAHSHRADADIPGIMDSLE
ncbi:hypothetical protein GU3_03520 [Oceanimonas sp. GK1]|nr:hypothetical protein GU3_03520 [Oceanimonas sp. GK1]